MPHITKYIHSKNQNKMKKPIIFKVIICCFLCLALSCEDETMLENTSTLNDSVSDENLKIATQNFHDFVNFLESTSKETRSWNNDAQIVTVNKKSIKVDITNKAVRSNLEIKDSVSLYYLTFFKNGENGFAIVSGDANVPKLYAYVEKGNIADTASIFGLNRTIKMIDDIYRDDIQNAYNNKGNRSAASSIYSGSTEVSPITGLKWHQDSPFNDLAPFLNSTTTLNGKAPAGCVPIALAMVIAHFESNRAIDLNQVDKFSKEVYIPRGSRNAGLVAQFLYDIGVICKINYGVDGSGATKDGALGVLNRYMLLWRESGNIDRQWAKVALDEGHPIFAFGSTGKSAHCWFIEGGVKDANGEYTHYYNNWGQGGYDNGLFPVGNSQHFTDSDGVVSDYYKDNHHIYITDVIKFDPGLLN